MNVRNAKKLKHMVNNDVGKSLRKSAIREREG